jgi:hypothetical protein
LGKKPNAEEVRKTKKMKQRRKTEEKAKGSLPFLKLWENKNQSNSEHNQTQHIRPDMSTPDPLMRPIIH